LACLRAEAEFDFRDYGGNRLEARWGKKRLREKGGGDKTAGLSVEHHLGAGGGPLNKSIGWGNLRAGSGKI